MGPDDLELFSSEALIRELMRRSTFQGIIIHAESDAKHADWNGERVFKVHYNAQNLAAEQAGRLLGFISESITPTGEFE